MFLQSLDSDIRPGPGRQTCCPRCPLALEFNGSPPKDPSVSRAPFIPCTVQYLRIDCGQTQTLIGNFGVPASCSPGSSSSQHVHGCCHAMELSSGQPVPSHPICDDHIYISSFRRISSTSHHYFLWLLSQSQLQEGERSITDLLLIQLGSGSAHLGFVMYERRTRAQGRISNAVD